jgi:hypothetical protein
LVEVYNQKIEERKIREDLIKSMGFSSPDKFINYMNKINKWFKTVSEDTISKWWDSEPFYKKVRNKFFYHFYSSDRIPNVNLGGTYKNISALGHQYHSKKEIKFEPDEFIYIGNYNDIVDLWYPVYIPKIPDCLITDIKSIPKIQDKKIKKKESIPPQTEPKITTPEKLKSEPTLTNNNGTDNVVPPVQTTVNKPVKTNFSVTWSDNTGKQNTHYFPNYNEWNSFVENNNWYSSTKENKMKSQAEAIYNGKLNLSVDKSY